MPKRTVCDLGFWMRPRPSTLVVQRYVMEEYVFGTVGAVRSRVIKLNRKSIGGDNV